MKAERRERLRHSRLVRGSCVAAAPLASERLAGRYRDGWYGDVVIVDEEGKLVMSFERTPQLTGVLEHWQSATYIVRWRDRTLNADAFVTFAQNPDAGVDEVTMRSVSPLTDWSFDFQDLSLQPVPRVP